MAIYFSVRFLDNLLSLRLTRSTLLYSLTCNLHHSPTKLQKLSSKFYDMLKKKLILFIFFSFLCGVSYDKLTESTHTCIILAAPVVGGRGVGWGHEVINCLSRQWDSFCSLSLPVSAGRRENNAPTTTLSFLYSYFPPICVDVFFSGSIGPARVCVLVNFTPIITICCERYTRAF